MMSEPVSPGPKAKLYLEYLETLGYYPELDPDGDVKFKHEGRTYYVFGEEGDPVYFRLVYPNFWSIDNDDERVRVLELMSDINGEYKVVKLYPSRNDSSASIEMFLDPLDNFKQTFPRAMGLLAECVTRFVRRMRNIPE
jgi:hypothetical protein